MQNQNIRFRSTEAEREHEQAARNFMRLAEYHVRRFNLQNQPANVLHIPPRLRLVGKQA